MSQQHQCSCASGPPPGPRLGPGPSPSPGGLAPGQRWFHDKENPQTLVLDLILDLILDLVLELVMDLILVLILVLELVMDLILVLELVMDLIQICPVQGRRQQEGLIDSRHSKVTQMRARAPSVKTPGKETHRRACTCPLERRAARSR